MREQVELTYLIGYPEQSEEFEAAVIKLASKLCGGCFVSTGDGYWAEDGADHKNTFEGVVVKEHCFSLSLTCELHKVRKVREQMKAGIAGYAGLHNIDTDWVHVKNSLFVGTHFSIKDSINSQRSLERDIISAGTRGAQ